jgi:hypothetical protein
VFPNGFMYIYLHVQQEHREALYALFRNKLPDTIQMHTWSYLCTHGHLFCGRLPGPLAGLGAARLGVGAAAGLGAAGLGTAGLGAAGLGATGLGAVGLGATGLGAAGLGAVGLGTVCGGTSG